MDNTEDDALLLTESVDDIDLLSLTGDDVTAAVDDAEGGLAGGAAGGESVFLS